MPRGPRLDAEGALHHVMVRGIERRKIFRTDEDREDLLRRIGAIGPGTGTGIYAWALMPNHFHLLVRTGRLPLSAFMRRVLTGYAVSFNRRHRRSGHLFQNRYKSVLVEEEPYLLELLRYIHLNPFREKQVETLEALDNYRWSGHAVLMERQSCEWQETVEVLNRFSKKKSRARVLCREFVGEGVGQGRRPELAGGGLIRSLGGLREVVGRVRGREKWASDERILGGSEFVERVLEEAEGRRRGAAGEGERPEAVVRRLVEEVALERGMTEAEVLAGSRRRDMVRARGEVSRRAVHEHGVSLRCVASVLRVSPQSIIRGVAAP